MMERRRFWYVIGVLSCLVFYVAYRGWFSWVALLAVALLPVLSLLLSLPAMLTTRLSLRCQWQGDRVYIHLDQEGKLPAPPVRCTIRAERMITGEVWIPQIGEFVDASHCGLLTFTAARGEIRDYLGLFAIPARDMEAVSVLIPPVSREIPDPKTMEDCLEGAWRPKPGGGFAENHELRPYRPGDQLNQIHWKMTAKVGKPIIREAMEPDRGRVVLSMDLRGTAKELDEKFGQLLWLSDNLAEEGVFHEILTFTGKGLRTHLIRTRADLDWALTELLGLPPAAEDGVLRHCPRSAWHYHLGGGADET